MRPIAASLFSNAAVASSRGPAMTEAVHRPVSSTAATRSACIFSAEQPEFRQVLPVDEVVEDEGREEDRDQHNRARQLDRCVAAIFGDACGLPVQGECQLRVSAVEPLAPEYRANRDYDEEGAS